MLKQECYNGKKKGGKKMIAGVGTDLVSIKRIKSLYLKYPDKFLERFLFEEERIRFLVRGASTTNLAGLFAAKEAVLKALGCGIGPVSLKEVEIISLKGNRPSVKLHGKALHIAKEMNIKDIKISISHEQPFAAAIAVAVH